MNKIRISYLILFIFNLTKLYAQSGSVLTYQQIQPALNNTFFSLTKWYAPILLSYTNSPSNTIFISFILIIILSLIIMYFVNKITQRTDKSIFTLSFLISTIFIHIIFSSRLLFTLTTIIAGIIFGLLLIGLGLWIRMKTMKLYSKLKETSYYFNNIIQGYKNLLIRDYQTINRLKVDNSQIYRLSNNIKHLTRNRYYKEVYYILENIEKDYREIYKEYFEITKMVNQMQRTRNPLLLIKINKGIERLKKLINRTMNYTNKNIRRLKLIARTNPQLYRIMLPLLNDYRNNLKMLENSIIYEEKIMRNIRNQIRKIKYPQRNIPTTNYYTSPNLPKRPTPPNMQNITRPPLNPKVQPTIHSKPTK